MKQTHSNADVLIEIYFNHEYRYLEFSLKKIDSGKEVYRNVRNLAEMERAGTVFNRNVLEEVANECKARLIQQVIL